MLPWAQTRLAGEGLLLLGNADGREKFVGGVKPPGGGRWGVKDGVVGLTVANDDREKRRELPTVVGESSEDEDVELADSIGWSNPTVLSMVAKIDDRGSALRSPPAVNGDCGEECDDNESLMGFCGCLVEEGLEVASDDERDEKPHSCTLVRVEDGGDIDDDDFGSSSDKSRWSSGVSVVMGVVREGVDGGSSLKSASEENASTDASTGGCDGDGDAVVEWSSQ